MLQDVPYFSSLVSPALLGLFTTACCEFAPSTLQVAGSSVKNLAVDLKFE